MQRSASNNVISENDKKLEFDAAVEIILKELGQYKQRVAQNLELTAQSPQTVRCCC